MSCDCKIIQVTSAGGAGPYTVSANTPSAGQVTVTDTASGESFVIVLNDTIKIADQDNDTQVVTVEGGGAGGGDRIDFIVDGNTVGSVEVLAGGDYKWTLNGILDPKAIQLEGITTVQRDALVGLTAGTVIYNSDINKFQFYNGTYWGCVPVDFQKEVLIHGPAAADEQTIFFTKEPITITEMLAVLTGGSTPSVTWTVRYAADRSAVGTEVVTGGTVTTNTTTGDEVTVFDSASIPADSFVWVEVTASTGSADEQFFHIRYIKNA